MLTAGLLTSSIFSPTKPVFITATLWSDNKHARTLIEIEEPDLISSFLSGNL